MTEPEVKWYAVTTRSKHEKVVAEQMWQKEIECFLPLPEVLSHGRTGERKFSSLSSRVIFSSTSPFKSGVWIF